VPRDLFIARTAAQAGTLYPVLCKHPAACLGSEPRIWAVGSGRLKSPYQAVTAAQGKALRAEHYQVTLIKHVQGLTVFLLTRAP